MINLKYKNIYLFREIWSPRQKADAVIKGSSLLLTLYMRKIISA